MSGPVSIQIPRGMSESSDMQASVEGPKPDCRESLTISDMSRTSVTFGSEFVTGSEDSCGYADSVVVMTMDNGNRISVTWQDGATGYDLGTAVISRT